MVNIFRAIKQKTAEVRVRPAAPTKQEIQAGMSIKDPFKAGRVSSGVVPFTPAGGAAIAATKSVGIVRRAGTAVRGAISSLARPSIPSTLKGIAGAAGTGLAALGIIKAAEKAADPKTNIIPTPAQITGAAAYGLNPLLATVGFTKGGVQRGTRSVKEFITHRGLPGVNMSVPWQTPNVAFTSPRDIKIDVPQIAVPEFSPVVSPMMSMGAPSYSISAGGGGIDPSMLLLLLGLTGAAGYGIGRRKRKKKRYKRRKRH